MPASTVDSNSSEAAKPKHYFATTHWSVVLAAGRDDTTSAGIALEKLCQTYWYPLYAYARRRGYSAHDAQDLTQGFFECLFKRDSLQNVDPNRGRFRSFILGAMSHFLADEWERARAQKRGSGQELLSLDWAAAEQRFDLEPAHDATPDKAFDKEWATALLDEVLRRLEEEYRAQGKTELFDGLKEALTSARESLPFAQLGARIGMSEGAARVAVHRMRKRYRELLRTEIANTVASPDDVKDEMSHLFRTMSEG